MPPSSSPPQPPRASQFPPRTLSSLPVLPDGICVPKEPHPHFCRSVQPSASCDGGTGGHWGVLGVLGGTGVTGRCWSSNARYRGPSTALTPPWLSPRPAARPPESWLLSRWSRWKQVRGGALDTPKVLNAPQYPPPGYCSTSLRTPKAPTYPHTSLYHSPPPQLLNIPPTSFNTSRYFSTSPQNSLIPLNTP